MKNFIIVILSTCFIGCSYISGPNGLFPDNSDDFFKEDLSEDLITDDNEISKDDHYPVFAAGEFQKEAIETPKPRQIFSSSESKEVQLRRLGELLWVYVEALPSTTWPITKSFLETSEYDLVNFNPEIGTFLVNYDDDVEMKVIIEHGIKESSTEIFLQFFDTNDSPLQEPIWITRSQAELEKLVEYIAESVDSFSGTSLAAQSLNDKKKAVIFNLDDQTVIELNLGFNRAWSAVLRALNNGEIFITDRDREEGYFLVSFDVTANQSSWFSFLNFAADDNAVALKGKSDYKIILKTIDNKTSISAENLNEVDGSTEALLSKINELLS